jgi:putative Mg2+ transporter-C (MgtC) family protein
MYNFPMYLDITDLIKVLLSVAAGGVIGVEREFRDKAAGFRTLIFICAGATIFTILSVKLAGDKDPARIAAQIVTGVGFLGAGAIMRDSQRVTGLTTAAAIWLTAALGMVIGAGEYILAGVILAVTSLVLWVFPLLERWIDNIREEHTYTVIFKTNPEKVSTLEKVFTDCRLRAYGRKHCKSDEITTITWQVYGKPDCHRALREALYNDPDIIEFKD